MKDSTSTSASPSASLESVLQELSLNGPEQVLDSIPDIRSEVVDMDGRVLGFVPIGTQCFACIFESFRRVVDPDAEATPSSEESVSDQKTKTKEDVFDAFLYAVIVQNQIDNIHMPAGKKSRKRLMGPYRHKTNAQLQRESGARGDTLLLHAHPLEDTRTLLTVYDQLESNGAGEFVFHRFLLVGEDPEPDLDRFCPTTLDVGVKNSKPKTWGLDVKLLDPIHVPFFEDAKRQGEVILRFAMAENLLFLSTLYCGLVLVPLDPETHRPRTGCACQWVHSDTFPSIDEALQSMRASSSDVDTDGASCSRAPENDDAAASEGTEDRVKRRLIANEVLAASHTFALPLCTADAVEVDALSATSILLDLDPCMSYVRVTMGGRDGSLITFVALDRDETVDLWIEVFSKMPSPVIRIQSTPCDMRVTGPDFIYYMHFLTGYSILCSIPHLSGGDFVFLPKSADADKALDTKDSSFANSFHVYVMGHQSNSRVALFPCKTFRAKTTMTLDRDAQYEQSGLMKNGTYTTVSVEEMQPSGLDELVMLFPENIVDLQVIANDSKTLPQLIVFDSCCVLNANRGKVRVLYFPPLDEYVVSKAHVPNTRRLHHSEVAIRRQIEACTSSLVQTTVERTAPAPDAVELCVDEEVGVVTKAEPAMEGETASEPSLTPAQLRNKSFVSPTYEQHVAETRRNVPLPGSDMSPLVHIGHIDRIDLLSKLVREGGVLSGVPGRRDASSPFVFLSSKDEQYTWLQTDLARHGIVTLECSPRDAETEGSGRPVRFLYVHRIDTRFTLSELSAACPHTDDISSLLPIVDAGLALLQCRESVMTRDWFACLPIPNPRVDDASAHPAVVEDLLYTLVESLSNTSLSYLVDIHRLDLDDLDVLSAKRTESNMSSLKEARRCLWGLYFSVYATYQNRDVYVFCLDDETSFSAWMEHLHVRAMRDDTPVSEHWEPYLSYRPSIKSPASHLALRLDDDSVLDDARRPVLRFSPLPIREITVRSCISDPQDPVGVLVYPNRLVFAPLLWCPPPVSE